MKILDIFKGLLDLKGKTLTVQFSNGLTKLIEQEAQEVGIDRVEVIKRAMALYYYVVEEARKKGLKLSITTERDEVLKDIILTEE